MLPAPWPIRAWLPSGSAGAPAALLTTFAVMAGPGSRPIPRGMTAESRLVLAGGGHSHALVLRMWAMNRRAIRRPTAQITLVSRHSTAVYSGMVPGVVAGLYDPAVCAIDLRRLCLLAGVTFVQAEIINLDPESRELGLEGRPNLRWDWLSLDVGAETASAGAGAIRSAAMAVKPLEPFLLWCSQPK